VPLCGAIPASQAGGESDSVPAAGTIAGPGAGPAASPFSLSLSVGGYCVGKLPLLHEWACGLSFTSAPPGRRYTEICS